MNYKPRKTFYFYSWLTVLPFFFSPAWAMNRSCEELKIKFHNHSAQVIQKIEAVEFCARPAAQFRGKVFSNLKYRANRLRTCVKMVKHGELGFDCSREFRKTVKADGGENCAEQLEVMGDSFKNFEALFQEYQTCLSGK